FGLTVIGIPSFIMTLAMMQIAAGISAMLVRGQIAYKVPPLITTLGSGSIAGVPWIVIVAALMLLLGHLVLTYTRFGRYVYMVGGTSLFGGRGGIGNTIVGLFVLGVLNNGLDHVNIDSFLKILIRGLILLAALVINVYAQRLRAKAAD
ncbi:MAG: ABC transporter permease, partial [Bradyrhizobium sp.]|nr:ABC transporter permease [Bradyrhizobium sp.]